MRKQAPEGTNNLARIKAGHGNLQFYSLHNDDEEPCHMEVNSHYRPGRSEEKYLNRLNMSEKRYLRRIDYIPFYTILKKEDAPNKYSLKLKNWFNGQ